MCHASINCHAGVLPHVEVWGFWMVSGQYFEISLGARSKHRQLQLQQGSLSALYCGISIF
jgi:hypothetical protein